MRAHLPNCLIAALALAAAPLRAQEESAPPADTREILVERERAVDVRTAGAVAEAVAGRPRAREPMARFNVPLCLSLAIDDPERGTLIGRRIIANARAAGLAIARPGCRPNALVVIADDVRGMIEARRRSGRRFFVRLKRHEVDRAMRVRDPAFVFHEITVTTSSRGQIDRYSRKDMIAGVVMMERGPSDEFAPRQVADYATLRLLAPTREMEELARGAPRTILSLFAAPGTAPPEMSRLDREYLAALYRLPTSSHAIEVLLAAARAIAGTPPRRKR